MCMVDRMYMGENVLLLLLLGGGGGRDGGTISIFEGGIVELIVFFLCPFCFWRIHTLALWPYNFHSLILAKKQHAQA